LTTADDPADPYFTPPPGAQPPGPPQYGAPGYGQPQYGAPQFGGPSYGQPPYGQPPYGYSQQPAYGYGPPLGTMPGSVASMGARLLARIIDGLLIGAVAVAIMIPAGIGAFHSAHTVTNADGTTTTTLNSGFVTAVLVSLAIFALISIFYEVGFIAIRGATLGKQATGVRVVRSDNGQVPGWGPSFVRWIIPTAANFVCGLLSLLVYISPFFDNTHRNQGWHDKAASTFVIRTR
jgi:uncharacterized RDD family membrane protein YckC